MYLGGQVDHESYVTCSAWFKSYRGGRAGPPRTPTTRQTVPIYFHVFNTVADACWLYPLNDLPSLDFFGWELCATLHFSVPCRTFRNRCFSFGNTSLLVITNLGGHVYFRTASFRKKSRSAWPAAGRSRIHLDIFTEKSRRPSYSHSSNLILKALNCGIVKNMGKKRFVCAYR